MPIRVSRGKGRSVSGRDRPTILPNEPANASEMRSIVADFLARERLPEDMIDEVLLAVGEVVANACRHGRNPSGGQVFINCELRDNQVIVTVTDDGPGFDVRILAEGVPDLLSLGGRGFFLMRQLMDRVMVESDDSGTTVVLERSLPK